MTVTSSAQALRALERPEQLDALVNDSHQRPILIFKHSRTCGTSAEAFDQLQSFIEDRDGAEIYLVDVLRHRSASQAVASRFGIRHESPQALVLRNGQVVWHGSHYRVTVGAIRGAIADPAEPTAVS